ncbi:Compactin diketide synthase, partial [Penicillium rolfsii]
RSVEIDISSDSVHKDSVLRRRACTRKTLRKSISNDIACSVSPRKVENSTRNLAQPQASVKLYPAIYTCNDARSLSWRAMWSILKTCKGPSSNAMLPSRLAKVPATGIPKDRAYLLDERSSTQITKRWKLHQVEGNESLDFFVSFSSIFGLLGQLGQANSAAANTFLDTFVQSRQSIGLPASVLDLGIFNDIGYVSESGRMTDRRLAVWDAQTTQENDVIESVKMACSGQHYVIIGLALGAATPLTRLAGFFQPDK